MGNKHKCTLIVPTLNAGTMWKRWIEGIKIQKRAIEDILVLDSESDDNTVFDSREAGLRIVEIKRPDFNHGATRQYGVTLCPNAEIIIFLTQDAILADQASLEELIRAFDDPQVGAAFGRQLPHRGAGPLGAHARFFNYPDKSSVKSREDAKQLGIKAAFISNSFAAYRRTALLKVGGFPSNTILSEDTYVAAKMLLAGWKIAYCADARVYHSHDYTYLQEFKRYFDIGVFHAKEAWIREQFGQAEGEGARFVLSELKYLFHTGNWYLLPSAFIRTALKYLGYRLGMQEQTLPVFLKLRLSMHRRYWQQNSCILKGENRLKTPGNNMGG
ncbi:O antigen biosynthesis rhamnosyltransferase RfbN [Propionispora sp. 2/2-37]|uniref:glycosyltransferase n=1 Tax=Propionispora sp. 2/2-37 TaxID=1677858 RepID=UPI0006BB71E4|nr:glycosyltransferase family 2 protein [Propionispora sp. 2/2-37]CUH94468.1 O antigen biosynthesis rhamnosyltransferase RfbN [Propionispora sp. 2/2-37]